MANATSAWKNPPHNFIHAVRIQRSLVAAFERRALNWLAKRTPTCINSDHLTLLGFVSQCMVGVCYTLSRLKPDMLLASIVFLALNWLGDSLDGNVASSKDVRATKACLMNSDTTSPSKL